MERFDLDPQNLISLKHNCVDHESSSAAFDPLLKT